MQDFLSHLPLTFHLENLNLCEWAQNTNLAGSHLLRKDIDQRRVLSLSCMYKGWTAVERGSWCFFLIRKSGWHAAKKAKTRFNSQTTTSLLKIKLSIQIRWDAHKSGKAVLGSIMTLLTLLLIMLTDLLAWEHIKTLQPPFTRCFRYKKGRFEIWTGSHKNRVGFKDDDQFGWGK